MREFNLRMLDAIVLHCYEWTDVKKPKGIIQIIPGFHEYLGRYSHFASQLNEMGLIVVGADHRGFGNSFAANQDEFIKRHRRRKSSRREKSGWDHYLDDQKVLNSYIQKRWPSLPIYVIGQTYGATLATRYAIDYGKTINGLVLSGMTFPKGARTRVIYNLSRANYALKGSNKIDMWLNHALSGALYPKERGRTDEAWISHDDNVIAEFHSNPLMTRDFNGEFVVNFVKNLRYNAHKKHLKRLPSDFPILIVAGKNDVVGNYTKQPRDFKERLKSMNKKVEFVTFPKWRNDTFTNPNQAQATKTFIEFVNKNL